MGVQQFPAAQPLRACAPQSLSDRAVRAGVQYIIDTVVEQCLLNPDRKFTYVEQAFFHRWWTEQPPGMQKVESASLLPLAWRIPLHGHSLKVTAVTVASTKHSSHTRRRHPQPQSQPPNPADT